MKTYGVECEWDNTGWWVVTIPEVTGAVTQCKRLDKVPDDVGEVLLDLAERAWGLLLRSGLHDGAVTTGSRPLLVTTHSVDLRAALLLEDLAQIPCLHLLHAE